jgi:peptidoglycan/LPS O-acetylase OafA/YrhL
VIVALRAHDLGVATVGTRVRTLDGLRGVAILLVVLGHYCGVMTATTFVDKLFHKLAVVGWSGVDLFFVLSGFLITGILQDTKGGEHFFRNFYVRRVLRIFPIYYASLLIFFVVVPLFVMTSLTYRGHSEHLHTLLHNQGWYWSYLTNVLIAREGNLEATPLHTAHFWSLAVEEQFYLLWPAVIYMLSRQRLIGLCVAVAVVALALRTFLVIVGVNPLATYVLTPCRLDALTMGGLIALVARGPGGLSVLARKARLVVVAGVGVVLGIFVRQRGFRTLDPVVETAGYTVLALLFGGVLVLALTAPGGSWTRTILEHPTLVSVGRYSYAIYIVHFPLVPVLQRGILPGGALPLVLGSQIPAAIGFIMVGALVSLGLALVSWHVLEKRFFKLKDLFPYGLPARV